MKPRKYIVADEEQELDVFGKLEKEGFKWITNDSPLEWLPSKEVFTKFGFNFPYLIVAYDDRTIIWSSNVEGSNGKVVFDGRKEDKMTRKYKVTKEFIDKLVEWRDDECIDATSGKNYNYINDNDLDELPAVVEGWWVYDNDPIERNNRLIAIIQWLNGDEVFEVEEPHKFIIRSEKPNWDGDYWYVIFKEGMTDTTTHLSKATKFSTREEAKEWANSHQVVIEVDADGKEG